MCRHARGPSQQTAFSKGKRQAVADDEVVENAHIDQLECTLERLREHFVRAAGFGKAGWMVVEGSDSVLVNKFLTALEYLSDTFLPVNEMVQAALPRLLSPRGFSEVARLAAMYRQRMESLIQAWRAHGIPVAMPDGGVYAIVPLPRAWQGREERFCVRLLETENILMHPSTYYGTFPEPALVMTCVATPPWPLERIVEEMQAHPE